MHKSTNQDLFENLLVPSTKDAIPFEGLSLSVLALKKASASQMSTCSKCPTAPIDVDMEMEKLISMYASMEPRHRIATKIEERTFAASSSEYLVELPKPTKFCRTRSKPVV
jgi:hypothetical protein